jgi:alkanesulfonate monooxygenase SsuD/methylene tetrahydromethanopterin reductase-like flavin-dependent oxidoreductase (luciferase family)
MQLDLHVSRFDWAGGPSGIAEGVAGLAARAEGVGIKTLSFMDHFFQMDWMAPAEDPMLECYTALAFVAGRTQTLRLRALVTGVTYRHPGILAKTITTLDVVSQGRAELGIGAAWYEREHRGLGVPFPPTAERFERLEEAIQICLQMWSDDNGPVPRAALPTRGDVVQPGAGQRAAAAPHDRWERRTEDTATRGAVRRRLQHLRWARRRRAQGRSAAPTLRCRRPRSE